MDIENYKVPEGYVLILRTCKSDMTSRNEFKWPESGEVTCLDWRSTKECGNGLHGLLKGEGDASLMDWSMNAKWIVAEVLQSTIIDLEGKVKFPLANVIYTGDQKTASNIIKRIYPECNVHGSTATAGNYGTATAGNYGTATAGYQGTATAGDKGTATAGNYGTATAGYQGTATAGYQGTATAGGKGTATAGDEGILIITYYDGNNYKRKIALTGESGIKPNIKYMLNSSFEFEEVV